MMHKRILAAATAVLLALGMSLGGAGVALASVQELPPPETAPAANTENTSSSDDRAKGCPSNVDGYGPKIDVKEKVGTIDYEADAGFLISAYCVKAGSVKQGFGPRFVSSNSPVAKVTIDHPDKDSISHYSVKLVKAPSVIGPAAPIQVNKSLAYLYIKLDFNKPAAFQNSGVQNLIAQKPGTEFLEMSDIELSPEICGEGWALQYDVIKYQQGMFEVPKTFAFPATPFSSAGVLVKAKHVDLKLDACPPESAVASAANPFMAATCDLSASVIRSAAVTNAVWGSTEMVGSNYTMVATRTGTALFPANAVGVSEDRTKLTFRGVLPGPDLTLCFQLPSLPNWAASVTATNQVCTPLGMRGGAITVQLSTGPAGNEVPVRYFLAFGTAEQRELTSATTAVSAGAYTVTATTSNSADSVNSAGNAATFAVVVGAPVGGTCDLPTLAFTGDSELPTLAVTGASELTGVAGLIALLLTLTGVALLAAQRRARV